MTPRARANGLPTDDEGSDIPIEPVKEDRPATGPPSPTTVAKDRDPAVTAVSVDPEPHTST